MKKLFVVLFVVVFAATSAYAVEFQTSGSYYARGSWISNDNGLQADAVDYGYYDHELDMTTTIVVADNTKIIVNYEIHDSNWITSNHDGWNQDGSSNLDDNIEFKRVFSSHTFTSTGTTLDLGLMTGGAWATDFANNANGRYRVKVTQATPIGPLFAILEKNAESSDGAVEDSEKDDGDFYYLAMVAKMGPVNVKPLLGYGDQSQTVLDRGGDGLEMITFQLGIDGSFDVWGFESDFVYIGRDNDPGDSTDNFGFYIKPWFKAGPAKIYGIFAYGDEDDGSPFAMGDDFEPLTFFANWTAFGPVADHFAACSLYVLGMDFAATDALSFNGAIAYIDSNYDVAGNIWDDADAWEFDLGMTYKISDAVKYSVQFGYGDVDLNSAFEDPDGSWRLYHRFGISF
jgi:hypothetical protein